MSVEFTEEPTPDLKMKGADKTITVRLPIDQANALETVARVDEMPASEIVRIAVREHIERRRQDPRFMARLKARIDQDQRLLDKLREAPEAMP